MSERINVVLIIGGTSGIGEAFARRFHSLGKKVIVTGRNHEKLGALAQELPGLESREVSCSYSLLPDHHKRAELCSCVECASGVGHRKSHVV